MSQRSAALEFSGVPALECEIEQVLTDHQLTKIFEIDACKFHNTLQPMHVSKVLKRKRYWIIIFPSVQKGVISLLSVDRPWNKHGGQKLLDGPDMIGEFGSHGWGTLLPTRLF